MFSKHIYKQVNTEYTYQIQRLKMYLQKAEKDQ